MRALLGKAEFISCKSGQKVWPLFGKKHGQKLGQFLAKEGSSKPAKL
jgi:hypothetical protein